MKFLPSVAIISTLALAACQTTSREVAGSTVNDLKHLKVELVDMQASIGQVAIALDALAEKGGNINAEFTAYRGAVKDVESQAGRVRSIRQSLADSQQVYMKRWAKSSASIQDANLKLRSIERRDAIGADFDGLRSEGEGLRAEFDAWLMRLTDTRKYLEFDLNPTGLASMQNDLGSLKRSADALDTYLDSFVFDLAELIEALAVPATAGS